MNEKAAKISVAEVELEIAYEEWKVKKGNRDERMEMMPEFKRKHDQLWEARKAQQPKTFDPVKDEEKFQKKLDAFKESMDRGISPLPPSPKREDSMPSAPGVRETLPEWIDSTDVIQNLAPIPGDQIRQGLPTDVVEESPLLPMHQDRRLSLNDEPEKLAPIPEKPRYQDLKLSSVDEKADTSLHTGAQLHVNRVPTEDIPPSLGVSVAGLHPHASAWTKSPAWAQTAVAMTIGAALIGIGFSVYKLFQKFTYKMRENGSEKRRLHARDWKMKSRRMKIE